MFLGSTISLIASVLLLNQAPAVKPDPVRAVLFSHDDKTIIAAKENQVLLINKSDAVVLDRLTLDSPTVSALAFSSDGKTLAIASGKVGVSSEIVIHTLANNKFSTKPLFQFKAHNDLIQSVVFSPNGNQLVTCSYDRSVKIWSASDAKLLQELKDHSDAVYSVAFNKDGTMLASTGADRAVKIWNTSSWKKLHALSDSTDWVYTLAWSPTTNQLLAAGVDQSIRVWNVEPESAKLLLSAYAHTKSVVKATWTSDGARIISIGEDKVWKIWDATKLNEIKTFPAFSDVPSVLALSKDNSFAAIGRVDGKLDLFDLKTGKSMRVLIPFKQPKAEIKSIDPAFITLGKPTTFTIKVDHLDSPLVASTSTKGFTLTLLKNNLKNEIKLEGQTGPSASSGVCNILLKNTFGQELNIDLEVDRFLRIEEQEPNDSRLTAQPLHLPCTLKSALQRAGDCDWFSVEAVLGQELAIQLQTEKDDKVFNPVMQLVNPEGVVVSESSNGWIAHSCSLKGRYSIEVRDRDYRGGPTLGTYRLHLGNFPIVTSVFPLGAQAGKEITWMLQGVGLNGKNNIKATIPISYKAGSTIPFEQLFPGIFSVTGKTILVSDVPEIIYKQNEAISLPGVGNALFSSATDIHLWKFYARKGQKVFVETLASRIGSKVDTYLEILDAMGKPIPRLVLRGLAKTLTVFRDHDSANPGIRIENWNELAVNDFVLVGNELMKIRALPRNPDDDCRFYTIDNKRLGFEGTTPVHHFLGQPMYKVSLNLPGRTFPPNGLPQVTLFYQNDDGGPKQGKDSLLEFDPPADGTYLIRVREMQGRSGPDYGYRLLLREPNPDFNLRITPLKTQPALGSGIAMNVDIDRFDGFDAPVDLKVSGLPEGFQAPNLTIPRGELSVNFSLFASLKAKNPAKGFGKWTIKASSQSNGKLIEKSILLEAPTLGEPGDLRTFTEAQEVIAKKGAAIKILVKIERLNGFNARVPLEIKGLPHGATVLDVGLNGILILPGQVERLVTIQVEPWMQPGVYPFVVFSKQEGKNREFAAQTVIMKVVE